MAVSYKKLWKMLIDKDMKKKDLCAKAGISTASVTKMGKGGHVTTEVLAKICAAMDCGVDDIMEIVLDESEKIESQQGCYSPLLETQSQRDCPPLDTCNFLHTMVPKL